MGWVNSGRLHKETGSKRKDYEDQSKDKGNWVCMEKLSQHRYYQPNIYCYIIV